MEKLRHYLSRWPRPLFRLKRRLIPDLELKKLPLIGPIVHFLYKKSKTNFVVVLGHKMFLDPNDSLKLSIFDIYEPTETKFFQKHLQAGNVAIDVGANIGYYSLLMAKHVGPSGKVYSFEPAPANYALLTKNIALNGYQNILTFNKAASNEKAQKTLYLNPENLGDHRIYESGDERESVSIETDLIDECLKDVPAVDFIKMDIQGFEYFALKGMNSLIQRSPNLTIVTEFWPRGLQLAGANAQMYFQFLSSMGFKIGEMNESTGKISPTNLELLLGKLKDENDDFTTLVCSKARILDSYF